MHLGKAADIEIAIRPEHQTLGRTSTAVAKGIAAGRYEDVHESPRHPIVTQDGTRSRIAGIDVEIAVRPKDQARGAS